MIYNLPFGTYRFHSDILIRHPECEGNKCIFEYPCNDSFPCDSIDLNLSAGEYLFEVFGAAGISSVVIGGLGGYARAKIKITQHVPMYLYLGGRGKYMANESFNGGGGGPDPRWPDPRYVISGGGATDFRLNYNDLSSRFLIGSGGGSSIRYPGSSSGGGLTAYAHFLQLGANQTSTDVNGPYPGEFGKGGPCGGGGGLYGGAGSCGYESSGGSSFVYSADRETKEIRDINEIEISDGYLEGALNQRSGVAIITLIAKKHICQCQPKWIRIPHSNIPSLLANMVS